MVYDYIINEAQRFSVICVLLEGFYDHYISPLMQESCSL